MAFLTKHDKEDIQQMFKRLRGDVRLLFFTERESSIIIPGRQSCLTCKDTQALLEEVVALSDKLKLEVHDVASESDLAREYGINRVPALIMSAEGVKGKVRYFGMPSGYEFSVLLGSLIDVSSGQVGLSEQTIAALEDLEKDLHFQV